MSVLEDAYARAHPLRVNLAPCVNLADLRSTLCLRIWRAAALRSDVC